MTLYPIVTDTLDRFLDNINLSSGLSDPSEEKALVEMFKHFVNNNISYTKEEIRAYVFEKLTDSGRIQDEKTTYLAKVVASDIARVGDIVALTLKPQPIGGFR